MKWTGQLSTLRALTLVGILASIGVFVAFSGPARLSAAISGGCDAMVEGSLTESAQFTPFESRHSYRPEMSIDVAGSRTSTIVGDRASGGIDGLSVQWSITGDDGSVSRYFLKEPLPPEIGYGDFYVAGGLTLLQAPIDPAAGGYVEGLLAELEDRATGVKVGSFDAALTWGDPLENGIRLHYLAWSDGSKNFTLIGDRSAARIVNLGRGLVC
jgi:hypothetical protein